MDIKIELDENKGEGEEVIYKETVTDNTGMIVGGMLAGALIVAVAIIYAFGPERAAVTSDDGAITLPPFEINSPYSQTLAPGGDILLGDPNAKVKIVQYGDYQYPFCANFALQTEPQIKQNYIASGKANMIYKDLIVIDNFIRNGKESRNAALAANCAADQGKFWEYHDALFVVEAADRVENNGNLTKELFLAIADKLGMDKSTFESCYDTDKYSSEITSDTEEASKDLERLSTPSTLINGELVPGAQPYEVFATVIDKYLK